MAVVNPLFPDPGVIPNDASEMNVPINTWNLYLIADLPFLWVVALDLNPESMQFKLMKQPAISPIPADAPPPVGQLVSFSIPITDAQACGLLPAAGDS